MSTRPTYDGWEYMVRYIDPKVMSFARELNEFGKDGWELVTVTVENETPCAYLKRGRRLYFDDGSFADVSLEEIR